MGCWLKCSRVLTDGEDDAILDDEDDNGDAEDGEDDDDTDRLTRS